MFPVKTISTPTLSALSSAWYPSKKEVHPQVVMFSVRVVMWYAIFVIAVGVAPI